MTQATLEEQFAAHREGGDIGNCPDCGAAWELTERRGTVRGHTSDCRYPAWAKKQAS